MGHLHANSPHSSQAALKKTSLDPFTPKEGVQKLAKAAAVGEQGGEEEKMDEVRSKFEIINQPVTKISLIDLDYEVTE